MKTTLFALGALLAVVAGCDSEVVGGGGGAGGGSGGAGPTTTTGQQTGGGSTSEATGTSTGTTGGGGGGNSLGNCEQGAGTSAASSGGTSMCDADFTCDGGNVSVSCNDDGVTNTCECFLDGDLAGSCDGGNDGCSFPVNCCYALLGGVANPNPGPYGACVEEGGTVTSGSGGSNAICSGSYACDGGDLSIDCEELDGGSTCTCSDGQGFTLGTCGQEALTCEYESSCCYAIFNP